MYLQNKAKEAALAKKKKEEEEKRKKEQEAKKQQNADSGPSFEEVTEEEAARIEAEEKAKKEGKTVAKAADVGDEEEKDENGEKKNKGAKPNSGNGGITDKYEWTQTLEEATVNIFLPNGVKARDLSVVIKKKHLKVALKSKPNEPLIDGPLSKEVKTDETLWSVENDGKKSVL